ncbi:hypothetical protein [Legionella cardiaca]|uniref:Uncharacterized protein n=1 Tax=Legionella cardiaca TaxID=1071983 RepID=A0ABY8AN16_9GAMM|nr:hypothetical protein [Legionella cardiaca]WED42050.1 hypothetical protein PXX05_08900 [Legionella cardiaca]
MKTFIYQWSPTLLESIRQDINSYLEARPYSAHSSTVDFARENFIAEVDTEGCQEEEIYEKVTRYTQNKLLTETILSPAGGQALFSIPHLIMNDLTIREESTLNQYYKTGNFRQLVYTKDAKGDHFASLFLCFYGLRNSKENLLLDRKTGEVKQVDFVTYQSIFNPILSQLDKTVLEKTARKTLKFDIAPFAAVHIRLRLKATATKAEFIPITTKVAVNYTRFEPKNSDEMYSFKTLGCSADVSVYKEFINGITNDLAAIPTVHANISTMQFARKLKHCFSCLRMHNHNQFLCLLEDFYFQVKEYLACDAVNRKIKAVTADDIIEVVIECLQITKPELSDLVLVCQLMTALYNHKISAFASMRYSLGQLYYALSHYIGSRNDSERIRDETDEKTFSPELLEKIINNIHVDYLLAEFRKMETFHILKIKSCEVLYAYTIPTLAFEGEYDEVEYAFYSQISYIQQLEYSPLLTRQDYRLLLLERLHLLSNVIDKLDKSDYYNKERQAFVISKLSELLGLIQNFLYLSHNSALADKILTKPLEKQFDSIILGKKNSELKEGAFFQTLFTESDTDNYFFIEKVTKLWLAYLDSIAKLLTSPPASSTTDGDRLQLIRQLEQVKKQLNSQNQTLIANSVVIAEFRDLLEIFCTLNRPGFSSYFRAESAEWYDKLYKLAMGALENIYLLQIISKFYMGDYYLPNLQDELGQVLKPVQTYWSRLNFFQGTSFGQSYLEQFLKNITNQAADDYLLCMQYGVIEASQSEVEVKDELIVAQV